MIVLNQPSFTLNQFQEGHAHKNKVLLAFVFERVLDETGSSSERWRMAGSDDEILIGEGRSGERE